MAKYIDYESIAQNLLDEGAETVKKIREAGGREQADDYGKKAMGIWAQAQVYATLHLAQIVKDCK